MAKGEYKGVLCPKCGKKGLHVADHPYANGRKEPGKVSCCYCYARFIVNKKADKPNESRKDD